MNTSQKARSKGYLRQALFNYALISSHVPRCREHLALGIQDPSIPQKGHCGMVQVDNESNTSSIRACGAVREPRFRVLVNAHPPEVSRDAAYASVRLRQC